MGAVRDQTSNFLHCRGNTAGYAMREAVAHWCDCLVRAHPERTASLRRWRLTLPGRASSGGPGMQILQRNIALPILVDFGEMAGNPHPMRLLSLFHRQLAVMRRVCGIEALPTSQSRRLILRRRRRRLIGRRCGLTGGRKVVGRRRGWLGEGRSGGQEDDRQQSGHHASACRHVRDFPSVAQPCGGP